MPFVPESFSKVFSNIRSKKVASETSSLSVADFDELPTAEKQAALYKLSEAAAPWDKKRTFNWRNFLMAFMGLSFLACAVLASVALAVDVDSNPTLVAKLLTANTALDRLNLLPSNADWTFDFTKQAKYTFAPGGVVNANAATFPATVGNGMTMAMLNLGPCSILPPHLHPRATNYVVAISGTTQTYMIQENGARTIEQTLTPGQMTIFPQGSVHTMMNIGCENAQLISALNSDDAGTQNLANSLFSLPSNIVGTVLPGVNVNATIPQIPLVGTGSNYGPESCLAACHAAGKMIKRTW